MGPNKPGGHGIDREFWKGVAAFGIVLLAFAVLIWMIYEAAIKGNSQAYCNAKPFFTPFFILAFSILGLFLGGWALANWKVPAGLPYAGLAFRAGGGVAFFLIAAVVTTIMNLSVACAQTGTYEFTFRKPDRTVTVRPDLANSSFDEWYQNFSDGSSTAKGIIRYMASAPDAPPQELRIRLVVGANDLVCPINIKLHNNSGDFNKACKNRSAYSSIISFKFAEELRVIVGAEGTKEERGAPPEASTGGENSPTFRECFADIWAGESIDHPYNQGYNTKSYKPAEEYVILHLYRGRVCLEDGKHEIIYPKTSTLPLGSLKTFLHSIIPAAHAEDAEPCGSDPPDGPTFDEILRKLGSPDADDALVMLVENYRSYECKIYDALIDETTGANPALVGRLLKVLYLARVGWSNNRLITNDKFPNLTPLEKAKRVFDKVITNYIVNDDEEVRYQARRVLTSYPAKYMREKFESVRLGDLSAKQRPYFAYAGVFMYFKPVISGEHFNTGEMTSEIMNKVIAEYKKGAALQDDLDKEQDVTDSYVLDFGLASAVRNFEKSEKGALVPAEFKPSMKLFKDFLGNVAASPSAYPFNNQLGWASCFAFMEPTKALSTGSKKPLTLDDAEWFKGELITVNDRNFSLSETEPTKLKACPGASYADTETSVTKGTQVRRLLRKAETDEINWLFVQTKNGFGWLQEKPKQSPS